MTEFQAYKMYLALKAHFQTDDYDVIKMQGRIRASRSSFIGAGKEFAFRRLVKLYKDDEVCNFMVSNFIAGNHWGGVFNTEAAKEYADWKRRHQSLSYIFKNDLATLKDEAEEHGVDDIFAHAAGQHPFILRAFLRKSITPETLVIINKLTGFAADLKLDSDPVWPDVQRLIKKYAPFVKIKTENFKELYHGAGF
jgi:hypothetical protein